MRALNLLRPSLHYRRDAFDAGLRAAGYEVVDALTKPEPGDVVLAWNRTGGVGETAHHLERRGATVLVTENGYLGKHWRGGEWFALAVGHHAGAGKWPDGGPERWDSWGVELAPWKDGTETVILGQRGIGEPGIKSPDNWAEGVRSTIGFGRIRPHPGQGEGIPLEVDLANAREVVTWASGAALQALTLGVPVWYRFPQWIGAKACRPLSEYGAEPPRMDDRDRLAMFRRLAWAMWTLDEIRSGEPFLCLK